MSSKKKRRATGEDEQGFKRLAAPQRDDDRVKEEEDDRTEQMTRCGQPLFCLVETLDCAVNASCVACLHKLCAEETLLPHSRPNVRPEMCPRASSTRLIPKQKRWMGLYPKGCSVLTIGDGDLSFSLALVGFLGPDKVVATTYESRESIIESYPDTGRQNLQTLSELGCRVFHGVDAGDLASTFPLLDETFDFVVFNFPCIATSRAGEDGQSAEMSINQELLRNFGCGARRLLRGDGGFVHVSHKTKAAFKNWDVVGFVSGSDGEEEGEKDKIVEPLGAVVFDRCAYPGYVNRKAKDRKSFPASDAVTYVFSSHRIKPSLFMCASISLRWSNENWKSQVQDLRLKQEHPFIPVHRDLMDKLKQLLVERL